MIAIGCLITWWARVTIGRLWSSDVARQEVHRVVDWGPYRFVDAYARRTPVLIPFVRSICVVIDAEAKRIEVDLPEGLKDLNRS